MKPKSKTHRPKAVFYSVDDVADGLSVSSKTVRRKINDGELRAHRIGRQVRISKEDLDAFLARQRR